jgi:hypothetical protein
MKNLDLKQLEMIDNTVFYEGYSDHYFISYGKQRGLYVLVVESIDSFGEVVGSNYDFNSLSEAIRAVETMEEVKEIVNHGWDNCLNEEQVKNQLLEKFDADYLRKIGFEKYI